MSLPILCLDFDGVLHSYTSGWKGADVVPDGATRSIDECRGDLQWYACPYQKNATPEVLRG